MKDSRFIFWIKWLKTTSIIVACFGVFMAITSILPKESPSPIDTQINAAFFQEGEQLTKSMLDFQSWQYGVGASMLVSWSLLMLFIIAYPLRMKEHWAWKAMMVSLIGWFAIDQTISSLYQVMFNVNFNFVFLLLYLVPLLLIQKEFKKA